MSNQEALTSNFVTVGTEHGPMVSDGWHGTFVPASELLLAILNAASTPSTLEQLSSALDISPDQLAPVAQRLEQLGLLTRDRTSSDLTAIEMIGHAVLPHGRKADLHSLPPQPWSGSLGSPTTSLPADIEIPAGIRALFRRRSRRDFADIPLPLGRIADLLALSVFDAQSIGPAEKQAQHRVSPSAGGRHPIELFLLVDRVEGLEPGIYWVDAPSRGLTIVPGGREPARVLLEQTYPAAMRSDTPAAALYLAAATRRVAWKYEQNVLELVNRDAGAVLQTLYLVATALGLAATAVAVNEHPPNSAVARFAPEPIINVGAFCLGLPVKK
ncbi:SagB family peptide dehydrogenase [Flexivirga oryzae]|uniref:SagB-type dehydrogenase family enzyme n=1 Tax=Flexivirga oryzae TaxID=1794944 RepID=A0A839N4N5_9MICO|nr:SagB family peptide dehydrogenase [Flexivirga oryzae]MBB2890963.1 SagB-type dehydrogenase family enzyme [Flexivirga oryzae]